MPDGVIFKPSSFDRHDKAVKLVERFLPPRPAGRPRDVHVTEPRLRLQCQAFSGSVGNIPQYACVEPTGHLSDSDGTPILSVRKPQTANLTTCALVWHYGIPLNNGTTESGIGLCTFEPFWAIYDPGSSPPAFGDNMGTVANQWYLAAGNTGYKCLAVDTSRGRAFVRPVTAVADDTFAMVELDATLTVGGSALATILQWNGSTWDNTGASVTVHDPIERFEGEDGDKFWTKFQSASGRWEIVSPSTSDAEAPPMVYGGLYQGGCQSTANARVDVDDYSFESFNGVTTDIATGEITIETDGTYRIEATANVVYTGSFGGLPDYVISLSHSLELWKDSGAGYSQLGQSLSDLRIPIISNRSDIKQFAWFQDRDLLEGDIIKLRYLPNSPNASDYNNDVSDACFAVLKLA